MNKLVLTFGVLLATPACFDLEWDDNAGAGGGPGPVFPPGGGGGEGGGTGGTPTPGEEVGVCGEVDCSPLTPNGLRFAGAVPVANEFPNGLFADVRNHIATNGLDEILLGMGNTEELLTLPYELDSQTPTALEVVNSDGAHVTLRGLGGNSQLRVVDPETGLLYDRSLYVSSELSTAVAVGFAELFTTPSILDAAQAYAFAPGHRRIGIAYLNASSERNRLVDTAATITLAGATQTAWDQIDIPNATVGHHTATVHVGDKDATVDIEVTNTADSIETLLAQDHLACFGAYTPSGAFISGIAWTFKVAGQVVPPSGGLGSNCMSYEQPVIVTVTAGGKTIVATTH
ncbi:MAG: hypothetical protein ABI867_37555 [Kofleriaceae bacterium]